MSAKEEPISPTAKCKQCTKEISHAEAMTPEGQEYAQFFCGFECYKQWHKRDAEADDESQDQTEAPT